MVLLTNSIFTLRQTQLVYDLHKNVTIGLQVSISENHQLKCPDCTLQSGNFNCNMRYVGQTGRSFHTRYKEHYRDYKYNNKSSKHAQHLIENRHSIGSINSTTEILHIIRKGKLMDTWEKFHIIKKLH